MKLIVDQFDPLWITLVIMAIAYLAWIGTGVLLEAWTWQRAARRNRRKTSGTSIYRVEEVR